VYGVIHDAAMNFATSSALTRGDRAVTLDLQYQTIRAATTSDALRVRASATRVTNLVAHLESTVTAANGDVVSRATGTFLVRRRESQ
jgi:acyl-coenzyme A thioesterase PaaI-like protein